MLREGSQRRNLTVLAVVVVASLLAVGAAWAISPARDIKPVVAERLVLPDVPDRTRVAIIGDSYTAGSDMGGQRDFSWTRLVATRMYENQQPLLLSIDGNSGSGYVARGENDISFGDSIARTVTPEHRIVVVFGSRNDTGDDVTGAASAAYADVRRIAPDAQLVVIGVPWVNDRPPADITAIQGEVRDAALAAGATFVDPIAEGWFAGENASAIGVDGVHPTDSGHQLMANRIYPTLQRVDATVRGLSG